MNWRKFNSAMVYFLFAMACFGMIAVRGCFGQTLPAFGTDGGIVTAWTLPIGATCGTSGCMKSLTLTLTPPAGVSGTNVIPLGVVSSYTWRPGGFLYCGTWTASVVINWLDLSGTAVSSTALIGTVVEPCPSFAPSPATAISVKTTP